MFLLDGDPEYFSCRQPDPEFFFDAFLYLSDLSLDARLIQSKNLCPLNHPFQPMSYLNSSMNFQVLGVICLVFSVHMSASAQDPTPRYLVDDGDPPMSEVIGYATIGSDSAIVIDNTHSIFLVISDRREKLIGQNGSGACEHESITSFVVDGDTIFVLDHRLGRILGYSIHSGDCVSEIGMPELSDFTQIGRVDNRFFLANISKLPQEVIDDLRILLKGGTAVGSIEHAFTIQRNLPHGHVAAVLGMMDQLGMPELIAPKNSRFRRLVLGIIATRVFKSVSKLATSSMLDIRSASSTLNHELGLKCVDEDDLHEAMDELVKHKMAIECRLAQRHLAEGTMVLYDVTSSYVEGKHNEGAAYGENRDKEQGKKQIVMGLMTD